MNKYKEILEKITKTNLPTDISFIEELSNLGWSGLDYNDREFCIDIILRITADTIVIKDIADAELQLKYAKLIKKVYANVISSDIFGSSAEFDKYFLKFREHVEDL